MLWDLEQLINESLENLTNQNKINFIEEVKSFLNENDKKFKENGIIDTMKLIQHFNNETFNLLCNSSSYFKCHQISQLNKLYSEEELSRLSYTETNDIIKNMRLNVFQFCFKSKYKFNIEELSINNYIKACLIFLQNVNQKYINQIKVYNIIKSYLSKTKNICILKKNVSSLLSSNISLVPSLIKNNIIIYSVFKLNDESNYIHGLFLTDDLNKLQFIKNKLNQIVNSKPYTKRLKKIMKSELINLSDEQKYVHELITKYINFIIILGDAGTGKTTLGKCIFKSFKLKYSIALGWQGRLGYLLKTLYGKGSHIDKCVEMIKRETSMGITLKENIEIIILDEYSVIDIDKFWKVLYYFPNLKKLIILGDKKQMPPIGYGPMMKPSERHFNGSNFLFELTKNFRIDENSLKLKEFLDKIITNNLNNLKFNNREDIYENKSIYVIKSTTIKNDINYIMEYKNYLKEILNYNFKFQILTQKNIIKNLINIECLKFETRDEMNVTNIESIVNSCFFPGNQIVFRVNSTEDTKNNKNIKNSLVYTGEIAIIKEIYIINNDLDLDQQYDNRKILRSTSEIISSLEYLTMISLEDGKKINIGFYKLENISKGNTITTSSSQGDEYDIVIGYIHKNPTDTFTKEEFFTMSSRGKKMLILFCSNILDIINICNNKYKHPPNYIQYFLPKLNDIKPTIQNIDEIDKLKIKYNINIKNLDNINDVIIDVSDLPENNENLEHIYNNNSNTETIETFSSSGSFNPYNNYYDSIFQNDDNFDNNDSSFTLIENSDNSDNNNNNKYKNLFENNLIDINSNEINLNYISNNNNIKSIKNKSIVENNNTQILNRFKIFNFNNNNNNNNNNDYDKKNSSSETYKNFSEFFKERNKTNF